MATNFIVDALNSVLAGVEERLTSETFSCYDKDFVVNELLTISMTLPRQSGKTFAVNTCCKSQDYKWSHKDLKNPKFYQVLKVTEESLHRRTKYFFDEFDEVSFMMLRGIIAAKYDIITSNNYPLFIRLSTM